jgi:hypothetical protein
VSETSVEPSEVHPPAERDTVPRTDRGRVTRLSQNWLVIIAMAMPLFMLTADINGLTVALPTIGRDFGGSTTDLQWVMSEEAITRLGELSSALEDEAQATVDDAFLTGLTAAMILNGIVAIAAMGVGLLYRPPTSQGSDAATPDAAPADPPN